MLLESKKLSKVQLIVFLVEEVDVAKHGVDGWGRHGGHVEEPNVAAFGAFFAPGFFDVAGMGEVDDVLSGGGDENDSNIVEAFKDAVVSDIAYQLLLNVSAH